MTFNQFYANHFKEVVRYLSMRLRNEEEAKDFAQNIFIKIYSNWNRIDVSKGSYRTYLFTVVANALIDHFRSLGAKHASKAVSISEDLEAQFGHSTSTSEDIVNESEYRKNFKMVLDSLTTREKRVVILQTHGYKMREVSEKTGIPMGSVTGILYQLRQKFSKKSFELVGY